MRGSQVLMVRTDVVLIGANVALIGVNVPLIAPYVCPVSRDIFVVD